MKRLSVQEYYCQMAVLVSRRSTCVRRQVGCVLVDAQNRVLATGYNGRPSGFPHCTDEPCPGAKDPHGDTSRCEAVHAELNALLHCDRRADVVQAYCTDSPCLHCALALCSLPKLRLLFYLRPYTVNGLSILQQRGIVTTQYQLQEGTCE